MAYMLFLNQMLTSGNEANAKETTTAVHQMATLGPDINI